MSKVVAILLVLVLALLGYMALEKNNEPVTSNSGVAVEGSESDSVRGEDKKVISAPVSVYEEEAKYKTNLPESVKKDEKKKIASSVDVPASDHEQEVVTVLDVDSGEIISYVSERPFPLATFNFNREIGAFYEHGTDGSDSVEIEIRQNFARFKSVLVQGSASAKQTDDETEAFVRIGIVYKM